MNRTAQKEDTQEEDTQKEDKGIDVAIAYLTLVAANDPRAAAAIAQKFHAAGLALPAPFAAPAQATRSLAIGELDPARGAYLGTREVAPGLVVHAFTDDDFLRDAVGRQRILTFREAANELAGRNRRSYGEGTDYAVCAAIVSGTYADGDLALPSKELLHGRDAGGYPTRPGGNIYDLMKAGKLPKIAQAVANGQGDQCWAVSGSEHPASTSHVYPVRLTGGGHYWTLKDGSRSGIVPVRYYRRLSPGPAPAPGG